MLSTNLKDILLERGISKTTLSNASGVCKPTICRLVNSNIERLDVLTLERIAEALKIDPEDLLKWDK